jgi:hypothetical protein
MSELDANTRIAEFTADPVGFSIKQQKDGGATLETVLSAKNSFEPALTPEQESIYDNKAYQIYGENKPETTKSKNKSLLNRLFNREKREETVSGPSKLDDALASLGKDYNPLDVGMFDAFFKR